MNLFVVLAAALVVAVAIVIVLPLLRERSRSRADFETLLAGELRTRLAELERDRASGLLAESDYEAAQIDAERAALERLDALEAAAQRSQRTNALLAVAIALLLPAGGAGLYLNLGAPGTLRAPPAAAVEVAPEAAPELTPERIREAVGALREHLLENPEDVTAWTLLAQAHAALGDETAAVATFREARAALPDDLDLRIAFARHLVRSQGNALAGEASTLVAEVLAERPDDPDALFLAGAAAWRAGDSDAALTHWRRFATLPGLDAERLALVNSLIARAQSEQAAAVQVSVAIAPRFLGSLEPDRTVFVFARAAGGAAGPPLAAERLRAGDLPASIMLRPGALTGTAVAPGTALDIVARVSASGEVRRDRGDLEGRAQVTLGENSSVSVEIDQSVD